MAISLRIDPSDREGVRRRLEAVTTAREHDPESSTTATRDSDIPQRDPQRFGFKGAYPRVEKEDLTKELIDRAYHEIGIFRNAVDEWAERTWGDGWNLSTERDGWKDEAESFDEEVGIKAAFEEADKEQIRAVNGRCFVYLNLEDRNADDPSQPPAGVQGIADTQLVRDRHIEDVEWVEDPTHDRHGEITQVKVQFLASEEPEWVHADRLIFVREFEHPEEHAQGIPRALAWIQSVLLYENIKWAAGESYFRNASPLMEIQIDEELVGEVDPNDILDDIDRLQNNEVQRVVAEGWTIETVEGSTNLTSPSAYWQVAVDSLAVDSRVPKHILTGSAAGAIQSAEQDEERFYSRVSDRRQKYPDRLVHEWYDRLDELGIGPGAAPEDLSVEWPALDEPDTVEEMETEKQRADTISAYKDMDEPVPESLTDYTPGEMPEHPNPTDPQGQPQPPAQRPAQRPQRQPQPRPLGGEGWDYLAQPCSHSHEDVSKELPDDELAPVVEEATRRIRERFAQLRESIEDKLDDGQPSTALRQILLRRHAKEDMLEDILLDLYRQAAEAGSRRVWEWKGDSFAFARPTTEGELEALAAEKSEQIVGTLNRHLRHAAMTEAEDNPVIRQVGMTFDAAEERAETIGVSEAMRGYVQGEADAFQMSGEDKARYKTFSGACEICAPYEGTTVFVEDAAGLLPQHPSCRCILVPFEGGGIF